MMMGRGEIFHLSFDYQILSQMQNVFKIRLVPPKIEFSNQNEGDHLELVVDGER